MSDRPVSLNETEARALASAIVDPVARNLVNFTLATVRARFLKYADESATERESRLPAAPFDMAFLVHALVDTFKNPDVLRRMLDGQTIAEATGWDVPSDER